MLFSKGAKGELVLTDRQMKQLVDNMQTISDMVQEKEGMKFLTNAAVKTGDVVMQAVVEHILTSHRDALLHSDYYDLPKWHKDVEGVLRKISRGEVLGVIDTSENVEKLRKVGFQEIRDAVSNIFSPTLIYKIADKLVDFLQDEDCNIYMSQPHGQSM